MLEHVRGSDLPSFTDSFLDNIFVKAAAVDETDHIIRTLAKTIVGRRPPRLLLEHCAFVDRNEDKKDYKIFDLKCRYNIRALADKHGLEIGQFLICDLKDIGFESRGNTMTKEEANKADDADEEEMIRVFKTPESAEPTDIVALQHSILHKIGPYVFRTHRLYFVPSDDKQTALVPDLKKTVGEWQ